MANPLNLYATKVFSEHPLGLWALDDKADYIGFVNETNQDLSNWISLGVDSVVDATDENVFTIVPPDIPITDVFVNGVISDVNNEGTIEFVSPFMLNVADLNLDLETFSVSAYVYSFNKTVKFELGFYYTNPTTLETVEVFKTARITPTLSWATVAESFFLPESFSDLRIFIRAIYDQDESPYEIAIQAIYAGQWAEEFQLTSPGVELIQVPTNIAIQATYGIEAKAYGLLGYSGYYIADNNKLVARNAGIPLVFGSTNCTNITPKDNSPSLIIPGFGFLNQGGQYNKLTAEFWLRVQSNAIQPRRIFGPIQSDDGIYVEGPFMKLKIGNKVAAHFIREWDRPMLIDIRMSSLKADLIINGDVVVSLDLDPEEYRFPAKVANNLEQDWLGFYAYDDVPLLEIDSVGIYPYEVASLVAKRRWVYGQGVQVPTDIKGLDSSTSVFVDYPFAKYAKNFYFPNSSSWANGNIENLIVEDDALKAPNYTAPSIRFNNKTYDEWFEDLSSLQSQEDSFITLKPNQLWDSTDGHIAFTNLNFIREQTKSFYGVFQSTQLSEERKVLFDVTNSTTANKVQVYYESNLIGAAEGETVETEQSNTTVTVYGKRHGLRTGMKVLIAGTDRIPSGYHEVFVISDTEFSYTVSANEAAIVEREEDEDFLYAYDATIYYSFITKQSDGSFRTTIFYEAAGHSTGKSFMAGLHIPRFVREQGEELASFFGNRQNLSIYVGGSESLSNTFDGKIYRVGFTSPRNLKKIDHLFNEVGIPVDYENVFSNFGTTVYDAGDDYFGNDPDYWDLVLDGGDPYDFQSIKAIEHVATYTLVPKFDMGMFILDVAVNSYWEDYVPMSFFAKEAVDAYGKKSLNVSFVQVNLDYPTINSFNSNDTYDTTDNLVRAYVAFQYLKEGSNLLESNFSKIEPVNELAIVKPGSDWVTTKYEVVNGTIVYLPDDVDFRNVSLNLYLEYNIEGIATNPLKLRSLQVSSQSFGASPNKVGTKLGADIIPFKKSGQYFNYKSVPPFAIYKGSTPYLYTTSNSGIEIRTTYNNRNNVGMSIPINKTSAPFYKIGSMQIFLKYGKDLFPDVPIKLFEIESTEAYLQFFLMADSDNRKRGQIYVLNAITREVATGVNFFENGNIVNRPVLYSNKWTAVGISFPGFLDFSNFAGALRITSPIMFDNFTYYQTTFADDEERFGLRQWFGVSSLLGEPLDWSYWSGLETVGGEVVPTGEQAFIWQQVKYFSDTLREELNAGKIYQIYTGTNRNISDTDQLLLLQNYSYKSFNSISWTENTVNPI